MKIKFEDGSFLQVESTGKDLSLIQCAQNDRKVIMSSVKLTKTQTQELLNYLTKWMKGTNE